MVSSRDIALVGGLAVLVFLITRAGRDLFGALPSLGEGASSVGETISSGLGSVGESIQTGIGSIFRSEPIDAQQAGIRFDNDPTVSQAFLDEPARQIVQPEGSSVITRQDREGNVTTIFAGGSEVIGPEGQPVLPFQLGTLESIFSQNQALTPAEQFAIDQRGRPQDQNDFNQQRDIEGIEQIGGTIRETPIERLSLSQIIDQFNVSASQAADIRSRARDDFGGFDFGTNTGSGIGSAVIENPEISTRLPNLGAVSNPEFEGLTAEEIAFQLTGGNISNF